MGYIKKLFNKYWKRRLASDIIISVTLTIVIVLLLTAGSVIAHDFWLIPEFFSIPSSMQVHIYAHNGSNSVPVGIKVSNGVKS